MEKAKCEKIVKYKILGKELYDKIKKIDEYKDMDGWYVLDAVAMLIENAKASGKPVCCFNAKLMREAINKLGDDNAKIWVYPQDGEGMSQPCVIESVDKKTIIFLAPRLDEVNNDIR